MKRIHQQINKWINSLPFVRELNVTVTRDEHGTRITSNDLENGSPYNERVFDEIYAMAKGVEWFLEWQKERKKK
jgi:hypothetical protein